MVISIGLAVVVLSAFTAMQAFGDDDGDEGRQHAGYSERDGGHEGNDEHAGHEGGENLRFNASNPTWQAECSACHIAYPPGLLPAASWREMMDTLGDHFGSDASLDAETVAKILPFLEQNAAPERKAESTTDGKPVLRITETRWFKREHDEVSPATWKNPAVKSASNCMACHTAADKGDFNEDNIQIPR
ncbi:diheme cytochrome c [Candidatus Thiothrix sp. Deng01]|uniref:Diheme cytochrome c n=1 Tax=Candidatus Thiothrix phosphatis TaxID=3112415 RepID=A0ABU6CXW8_9GAMM|nr:diheme cytochrome c [Candidatus Thiothrix sp. Deng01]MEB4591676.1 diheme cytochrome c [Candidatus Thiothrix sp. Deng01]